MLARVQSFLLEGIDALPCEVEVDHDMTGDPSKPVVVGLADTAVKESLERVRSALVNAGYAFPSGRVLINLAPADVRKEGPAYDLPIAVGLLVVMGVIQERGGAGAGGGATGLTSAQQKRVRGQSRGSPVAAAIGSRQGGTGASGAGASPAAGTTRGEEEAGETPASLGPDDAEFAAQLDALTPEPIDLRRYLLAGELALDGRLRPIKGAIAMAALAASKGYQGVIVPAENAAEAAVVPGIESIGASTIVEVVGYLTGRLSPQPHPPLDVARMLSTAQVEIDFADVRGQEAVKRALVIAAAGMHNLLMLGPAGTGKSMMAKAFPGILPAMTPAEAIEVTRVYSAAGALPAGVGLITTRPVRCPHHTASQPAIVGGGMVPRPGEVSLAHKGVLFLDELAEFQRYVLETLRQPMEDHVVTIARSHSSVKFPASFQLLAAMNPTPKGDMPVGGPGGASHRAMERYLSKLSGPLIDRIDMHVEAPAVPWKQLSDTAGSRGTSSAMMREQVQRARAFAAKRAGQGASESGGRGLSSDLAVPNARLSGRQLDTLAPMNDDARAMLGQAIATLGLSARAYDKIRRVARTIADLAGSDKITLEHVAEAVQYRLLDRKV